MPSARKQRRKQPLTARADCPYTITMQPIRTAPIDRLMVLRAKGWSYRRIGRAVGVSGERVRQLISPTPPEKERRKMVFPPSGALNGRAVVINPESLAERIVIAIESYPSSVFSMADIAIITGTSRETVRRVFHALKTLRFLRHMPGRFNGRNWTRAGVTLSVKQLALLDVIIRLHRREEEGRKTWLSQPVRST